MSACVWYISKYAALPPLGKVGTRGFLIMREMAKAGNACVILTSNSNHLNPTPSIEGAHRIETIDGVQVCWIRTLQYQGVKSLGRILSWLDFEWRLWRLPKNHLPRPDAIIVSSLSLFTIFNGLMLRRQYGCRLVFEVRDIWPLTIIEEGGFSPRNPFVMALAMIERMAYRRSDAIVGTMPNLAEHVNDVIGTSPPVFCVPFGLDEALLEAGEPLPDGWTASHMPDRPFIVCHAGTIGATNALDTLFACARGMQDREDIHFLVVGEGALKAQYQAACADLPNVTFAPGVQKAMVQAVLERCQLLYFSVHPSKVWKYGLSLNKVIDYMLAGKPIVASYTGHPTMVDEAGSGTAVPAGDVEALKREILRYAAMPARDRDALGRKGRDWLLRNRRYPALANDYLQIAAPSRTP